MLLANVCAVNIKYDIFIENVIAVIMSHNFLIILSYRDRHFRICNKIKVWKPLVIVLNGLLMPDL